MTFSIVACEPHARQMGVAVASKFLAVGAVVPWLEAEVGAIATQALANTRYGPDGLAHLRDGLSAREALDAVLAADPGRDDRQAGFVDARGRAATHTGPELHGLGGRPRGRGLRRAGQHPHRARRRRRHGRDLRGGTGELAERLLLALAAGDAAGGDRRGRQSAAIVVVSPGAGYGGNDDRLVDLRSDDHADPVGELHRLYEIHVLLTGTTPEEQKLPLDGALARRGARVARARRLSQRGGRAA